MKHKICLLLVLISCTAQKADTDPKINGLCLVAPSFDIDENHYKPITAIGANWVAIIPYAFCSQDNPEVTFDHPWQWKGETTEGITNAIQLAQKKGLKIMLKPHIWVKGQGWAGDLNYNSEESINIWKRSYENYIMNYARLAEDHHVEMLSIGTEIRQIANNHPIYWKKLIEEVRNVYTGKITYSANWDNYENIKFWNDLDFIGIDAYFPLSDERSPIIESLIENSLFIKNKLEKFSAIHLKKVLFTEFGFMSSDYLAAGHWNQNNADKKLNLEAQAIAYETIFKVYWQEPWFAGGFAWKWYYNHNAAGGKNNSNFTPQNKPAEKILKKWYSIYSSD